MFLCPRGTAWAGERLLCPPYMVVATIAIEEISVGGKCMEWIHYSYGERRCAFPPYRAEGGQGEIAVIEQSEKVELPAAGESAD
jgi:hypothetical protein